MSNEYFNLWFRLDGRDAYLIWFNGEPDGVIVDVDRKVPCFSSNEDLSSYGFSLNLSVKTDEPILHDLDFVASWLKTENNLTVDCNVFLAAWNLFDDVSRSVGGSFGSNRKLTAKIYEKLFWGNNLPAVTPEGEHYEPTWTKRELEIMREVLGAGLSLFREKTSYV